MTIQVGDRIPSVALNVLKDGVQAIRSEDVFKGKTEVIRDSGTTDLAKLQSLLARGL